MLLYTNRKRDVGNYWLGLLEKGGRKLFFFFFFLQISESGV